MGMSVDDRRVISLWDNEISFDDGHYTLPIPWREGRPNLPHNMYMAKCRLDSLRRKLTRTGMTSKYSEQIEQMVDKGYAEPVPDDETKLNDGSVWYMPHHAIMNDAKPGKVRVVFYCAASQSGVSLNNQCMQGPGLVNRLLSVLLRFRQYHYTIMADIESEYLQVRIPPRDRHALRFFCGLWMTHSHITEWQAIYSVACGVQVAAHMH